jgi:hypothetical protein
MVFPLRLFPRRLRRDALFWQIWFQAVLSNAAAEGKPRRAREPCRAKKAAL